MKKHKSHIPDVHQVVRDLAKQVPHLVVSLNYSSNRDGYAWHARVRIKPDRDRAGFLADGNAHAPKEALADAMREMVGKMAPFALTEKARQA